MRPSSVVQVPWTMPGMENTLSGTVAKRPGRVGSAAKAYMTAGFSVPSGVVMWWFSGVS